MGRIVAVGGGEIGRPGHPVETLPIDREICRLSGRRRPRLLFLPTATRDSPLYVRTVEEHFRGRLGCEVEVLYLYERRPGAGGIRRQIDRAEIIYVGGGNTLRMMKRWRAFGVDRMLARAYSAGCVLAGVSAGAICWFAQGSSDSRRTVDPDAPLIRVRGMGLVNATFCPHYHSEKDRVGHLRELMGRTPGVAVAVDNCCALEIVDGRYRVITSATGAAAYVTYWRAGRYHEEQVRKTTAYRDLEDLLVSG